ncbi:MAG: DUF429 domain-containing protein [Mycobacterium sp.]|nr:DUF429 domain-containing protein [Mycobacterium sp.]
MYYVGVDLAWGERSPTGLAVLDCTGHLKHVGVAVSDSEIVAQLQPYLHEDCVVAVDAPLVVTNPTGNRHCEAALNRDFRRFDAGTHPANTGLAWFADGGRGARLSALLNADKTIEVYPHAASVALFGLDKTLKYKQKPGRGFDQLQAELLRLMDFLESLRSAEPNLDLETDQWAALKATVFSATRKAQLRRAEDPVDAVLCAYIARYATERPDDVTVYGDEATGCIVTPTYRPSTSSR